MNIYKTTQHNRDYTARVVVISIATGVAGALRLHRANAGDYYQRCNTTATLECLGKADCKHGPPPAQVIAVEQSA